MYVHVDDFFVFCVPSAQPVLDEIGAIVEFKTNGAVPDRCIGFDSYITDDVCSWVNMCMH